MITGPYAGENGENYFRRQFAASACLAQVEARKFAPSVSACHTVLDFGCGSGNILRNLACRCRLGVEVNSVARRFAEQQGILCLPSLDEVEAGSIDVLISNHALEHVSCPLDILGKMATSLKPTGKLVLCVPIDDWRSRYDPHDVNHHLYTWTPQLLGNCLVAAGFHVTPTSIRVLTEALPGRFTPVLWRWLPSWMFRLVVWGFAVVRRRRQLIAVVGL